LGKTTIPRLPLGAETRKQREKKERPKRLGRGLWSEFDGRGGGRKPSVMTTRGPRQGGRKLSKNYCRGFTSMQRGDGKGNHRYGSCSWGKVWVAIHQDA